MAIAARPAALKGTDRGALLGRCGTALAAPWPPFCAAVAGGAVTEVKAAL